MVGRPRRGANGGRPASAPATPRGPRGAASGALTRQYGSPDNLFVQSLLGGFTVAGLYAVNFLVVVTTVLMAVGSISQEVSSDTIHAIAAKPLRRWEIFLGKWLGHAIMLAGYVILLFGGILLVVYVVSGSYVPPAPLQGLALMLLEGLVMLSVTLLGSTVLSTLANGVVVFMLYGLAFLGGWAEQFGAMLQSQTAVDLGILSSLLLPTEALWRRAAYAMQTSLTRSFGASPFGASSVPSDAFILYAALYTLAVLGLAVWAFSRRDF